MDVTDYRRVIELILEELVAAGAVAPARCACHGFTYECCPERVRGDVPPKTYETFRLLAFESLSVPDVCSRLGLNSNQVYKAKSRVVAAVRRKMAELGFDEV